MTEECFFCDQEFELRKEHDDHIREEHDPNYKKNLYIFNRYKEGDDERGEMFRFVDGKIKELFKEGEVDRVRSYIIAVTRAMDPETPGEEIEKTKEYNISPADYETVMALIDEASEKYGPEELAEKEPEKG